MKAFINGFRHYHLFIGVALVVLSLTSENWVQQVIFGVIGIWYLHDIHKEHNRVLDWINAFYQTPQTSEEEE